MAEGNKVTINDVANAAGVSKGTVDRVLHNRGEVSPQSRERVLKVINELGFKPNAYASMLASKKLRKIICLIPEHRHGEFWELSAIGIEEGRRQAAEYGVSIEMVMYDQFDLASYKSACAETLSREPAGVVVAPMFRSETLKFSKNLKAKGIKYVYVDSKLEDDGYLAYFGMPMYWSGYLCAEMMSLLATGAVENVNIVRIVRDKKGLSDPTMLRRTGFYDYVNEFCPEWTINNIFISPKDKTLRYKTLDKMFAEMPAKNLVMFNSRVYLVAEYLKDRNIKDCKVIGYDVLERNLSALREGYVQMLIAQHPDRQMSAAINTLLEDIVFLRPLSKRDNYVQIDILTKYNCDYY